MHPAIVYGVQYAPEAAQWLWRNKDSIGPMFEPISRRVQDAMTGSSTIIDRLGPSLVSIQDGQTEVIGLLHRESDSLGQISSAVDHVLSGQEVITGSLNLVSTLSMVGLGVSALSHTVLSFQLSALTKRMKEVASRVKLVQETLQAKYRADLSAGVTHFAAAEKLSAREAEDSLREAKNKFVESKANFIEQLQVHIQNPEIAWLLVRHLTTAALGEAACYLKMGASELAVKSLESTLPHLRNHATTVFQRTIQTDPTRFLMPMLADRGITLESLAELYRQASLAGVVGPEQRRSATEFFESHRHNLHDVRDPKFRKAKIQGEMINQWIEASVAIEEVNRVNGLALAIKTYHGSNRSFEDLMVEISRLVEARQPTPGTCFAVFPEAPSS